MTQEKKERKKEKETFQAWAGEKAYTVYAFK